jgi:sialate O-acetylesterase
MSKSWKMLILFLFVSQFVFGNVTLSKLISNGMVLQREAKIHIWGWADAGEHVKITFVGSVYSVVTDQSGKWNITLKGLKAGGPYRMKIDAKNQIEIEDILIGDVWVCSGQSNMELSMERASPLYQQEIAHCENQFIRQFIVPKTYCFNEKRTDLPGGKWVSVNPETILSFSAVAYFFAAELYKKIQVPVGIINTAVGGSPAEAWMSEEALKSYPNYYNEVQLFKNQKHIDSIQLADRTRTQNWYSELGQNDAGNKNPYKRWSTDEADTAGWQPASIPGYWESQPLKGLNGVVWYKKTFELPDSLAGQVAKLNLGRIVDADSAFVNGVFTGTTSYQYPPRRYKVPAGILKAGKNTIVIKVVSNIGVGGFVPDKRYELVIGNQTIDLQGKWYYRIGAQSKPLMGQTFINWKPAGLYNAMLHPLVKYGIKGVVWYQGEANTGKADEYKRLLPALINDWRKSWNQGDYPFLYVQLPNFMESKPEPSESDWARLREAQLKTLSVANTAMVVAIDLGEWNDIHPLNKKDVGARLALAAQNIAYNQKQVIYSGPIFKSMKIDGNKIILTFDHIGTGLNSKEADHLVGFAIAGDNRKFAWANAKIEGNTIVVWSDTLTNPVAVRYAWADNPAGANLYNSAGLPASPFRTEDWGKE